MLYFSAIFRIPNFTSASIMGINAVDVLMAVIIVSIIYMGRNDGIVAELVKLFGVFCAVFITLHYYSRFADLLREKFFGKDASTEFFAYSLLAITTLLILFFISKSWTLILKIKFLKIIDRWGNLILSLIQGYFLCGLIFLGLILSAHDYAISQTKSSVSRALFQNAAVEFYRVSYSEFIEKYFPDEKMNEEVFALIGEKPERKKAR